MPILLTDELDGIRCFLGMFFEGSYSRIGTKVISIGLDLLVSVNGGW